MDIARAYRPPECHPERREFRSELRNDGVEVLHSVVVFRNKLRNGAKRSKTDEEVRFAHDRGRDYSNGSPISLRAGG